MAQGKELRENLKATRDAGKAGREATRNWLEKRRLFFTILVLVFVGIVLAVRDVWFQDVDGALLTAAGFFVAGPLGALWVHKMGWDRSSNKSR